MRGSGVAHRLPHSVTFGLLLAEAGHLRRLYRFLLPATLRAHQEQQQGPQPHDAHLPASVTSRVSSQRAGISKPAYPASPSSCGAASISSGKDLSAVDAEPRASEPRVSWIVPMSRSHSRSVASASTTSRAQWGVSGGKGHALQRQRPSWRPPSKTGRRSDGRGLRLACGPGCAPSASPPPQPRAFSESVSGVVGVMPLDLMNLMSPRDRHDHRAQMRFCETKGGVGKLGTPEQHIGPSF